MRKPRRIDIAELIVQRIENQAAYDQAEHQQQKHCRVKHTNEHSHMVQGKQYRAEEISELDAYILFQRDKPESAEEKLLQKRIHNGYVDCHPYEVVRCNPHAFGQAGCDTAEIDDSTQSKISAEDDSEDGDAERERNKQPFLSETEQSFEFVPFLTPECEEQHRERKKKQNLDRDFREIRRMYDRVNESYSEGKQHHSQKDIVSFSFHRQSHFLFFNKARHN